MHRRAIIAALCLVVAASAEAQVSAEYRKAFDVADRDAITVVEHFSCIAKHSTYAGQLGRDGELVCARIGSRMLASVVVPAITGPMIFNAVDISNDIRVDQPDTAEVLTLLRAKRSAESRALIDVRPDTVDFLPAIVYRQDSVIHAWVVPGSILPAPTGAYVGGERHYILSRDASRELQRTPSPARRPVKGISNGEWIIESQDSIPTFSELLMAHMLRMDSRPVSILMPKRIAKLSGDARTATWVFLPRTP